MATEVLKRRFRRYYSGVSWQHPVVAAAMPAIDVIDHQTRRRRGLGHLPRYSARIRSSGMGDEFGGHKFTTTGEQTKSNLIEHFGLAPDQRVLEVGCGAGRTATALVGYLQSGAFVGFDVDEPSIRACQDCSHLQGFEFFHADVDNSLYRPDAATKASDYRFPLEDNSFDLVFLASVYTHLMDDDAANYSREILRVLKPGGIAAVSTFLRTEPVEGQAHGFAHPVGQAWVEYPELPTKIVSYDLSAFQEWFGEVEVLKGRWRRDGHHDIDEWQDWVRVHG